MDLARSSSVASGGGPPPPRGAVQPSDLSFETLCKLFASLKSGTVKKKRRGGLRAQRVEYLKLFIRKCVLRDSNDAFSIFRLFLPKVRVILVSRRGSSTSAASGWTCSNPPRS